MLNYLMLNYEQLDHFIQKTRMLWRNNLLFSGIPCSWITDDFGTV